MRRALLAIGLLLPGAAFAVDGPQLQGDLILTEFMAQPQEVPDFYGQWFELTNAGNVLIDIEGVTITNKAGETVTIGQSYLLAVGDSLVLGVAEQDQDIYPNGGDGKQDNGNIPVDLLYAYNDFKLVRTGDEITIRNADGVLLDEVAWDSSWGVTTARSWQVSPQGYLEWANDLPHNWCASDLFINPFGLKATPGVTNDYCLGAGDDADGDGWSEAQGDCDDKDPYVNPGAVDGAGDPYGVANDDADCDGVRDDGLTDDDGDGYSEIDGDCDDDQLAINPGKSEGKTADGIDNDCNCYIDDLDRDNDGFPDLYGSDVEFDPSGISYKNANDEYPLCDQDAVHDCADEGVINGVPSQQIYPGATEVPYDAVDQDCDGEDLCDVDLDGYKSDECENGTDCDDDDPEIHPGAADALIEPDGLDNDCDGTVDSPDADGDGYGRGDGDCDDDNPAVNPGAIEECDDNLDNNCDGFYNENCSYPGLNTSLQGGGFFCGLGPGGGRTTGGLLALALALTLTRRRR